MTQPTTDETLPTTQRTFEVETVLTVTVDGGKDAERAARRKADEILQRAWDTDRGRHHVDTNWHFELLDGGLVTDVTDEL